MPVLLSAADKLVGQQPAMLPVAAVKPLTPPKCLSLHLPCSLQAEGLDDLLHMVDYLQAASVKNACDRVSGSGTRWGRGRWRHGAAAPAATLTQHAALS